jgi:Mce-associated membrane protein
MSPRRRLDRRSEKTTVLAAKPSAKPIEEWMQKFGQAVRRNWGLALANAVAVVLLVAALTASGLMLWQHEVDRRSTVREVAVLDYVKAFMTNYTTLDPFNANAYADRILGQSTGEFAKQFQARQNEILLSVAQGEPTTGMVTEAGIEKRHEDGSISVLVATKTRMTATDGKTLIETGDRWVVTAVREGPQWKISRLNQVI